MRNRHEAREHGAKEVAHIAGVLICDHTACNKMTNATSSHCSHISEDRKHGGFDSCHVTGGDAAMPPAEISGIFCCVLQYRAHHSVCCFLIRHVIFRHTRPAMIVDSACRSHSARSAQRAERQGSPAAPPVGRGRPCRVTHLGQYAFTPYLLSLRSSLRSPTPLALGL